MIKTVRWNTLLNWWNGKTHASIPESDLLILQDFICVSFIRFCFCWVLGFLSTKPRQTRFDHLCWCKTLLCDLSKLPVSSGPRDPVSFFQFTSSMCVSTKFAPLFSEIEQFVFGVSLFNWHLLQYRQAGMHLTTCFENETNNAFQINVWDSIRISYTTTDFSLIVDVWAFLYPWTQFETWNTSVWVEKSSPHKTEPVDAHLQPRREPREWDGRVKPSQRVVQDGSNGGLLNGGTPIAGWFTREQIIYWLIWGYNHFRKHPNWDGHWD